MKIFQIHFKIPVWYMLEILNFDRSGPSGKFSISNFYRSGICLKNVDLCNTLPARQILTGSRPYMYKNVCLYPFSHMLCIYHQRIIDKPEA